MRVLILAIHYPVASGRYMLDALRRIGHDTHSAGPCTRNEIWGIQVDPKYAWIADPIPDGWEPELVIIADSGMTYNRLDSVNSHVPTVVYGVDNHVRDYRQFGDIADHFFLAHGHGARIGEPNVTWLPCGYDPAVFTPGKPWFERFYPVSMVGVMYDARRTLIEKLTNEIPGLSIQHGMGAVYDQYADIYQRTQISLVKSAAGDVAQRIWETAAMGCLVIMDDCPDCAALGLVDGENCLIYHTDDEAAEKVRWALTHSLEAAEIAAQGQAWAQSGTWDKRLQVIIDWAEKRALNAQKAETK